MRRTLVAAAALVTFVGVVESVQAQFLDDTYQHIRRGYHRNEQWPWPYICADRIAVRDPFCTMVNNGWRRQNLLGAHHFQGEENELNTAGQLRVRWIMTQVPPDRRNVFIERAADPGVTQQRLATVRDYAAQFTIDGSVPQVWETHLVSEGRPAATVDAANVRFHEGQQPPSMLPAATAAFGTSTP